MTLTIRPVKLKQSIYFRVPNDIADLIGIDPRAEVTLNLEEQDDRFLLIYSVRKSPFPVAAQPVHLPVLFHQDDAARLAPVPKAQRSRTASHQG